MGERVRDTTWPRRLVSERADPGRARAPLLVPALHSRSSSVLNAIMTEEGLEKNLLSRLEEDQARTEVLSPRPKGDPLRTSSGGTELTEHILDARLAIKIAESARPGIAHIM